MHGFLIHTKDARLLVRNYDYIKYDNPGWWQDNLALVGSFWEFNTDDYEGMKAILLSLRRISAIPGEITQTDVKLFCQSVGFDLQKFTEENRTDQAHFAKVKGQNWDHSAKTAVGGFGAGSSASATPEKKKDD